MSSIKKLKKVNLNKIPHMHGVKNNYDPFKLDFLRTDERGKIWNGEFDVTDAPKKLIGVSSGAEEIKLTDYLVYRPIPKELIAWREIPNYHPDSMDMEDWYRPLVNFCYRGVWVDGEYYNPYFVYWLNIFVFPVPVYDKDGQPTEDFIVSHPQYSNIDRYYFDYSWKAYLNHKDSAIMGGRGVGKATSLGTELPIVGGLYKKMGDIELGDQVFDRSGRPTTVTAIYDHQDKDMYRVTLKDGRSLDVCNEHLWGVYDHKKKYNLPERDKPTDRYPKGRFKKVKGVYTVVDTQTIINEGLTMGTRCDNRWYLPMQEAVQRPEINYIIDPYIMGALLGDGGVSLKSTITMTTHTDDIQIINLIAERLPKGAFISKKAGKYSWSISGDGKYNPVLNELRRLGVQGHNCYNKSIPETYLTGSERQRLELLRGLMDADGGTTSTGTPEWSSVSEELANDFCKLCASLGIRFSRDIKLREGNGVGYDYRVRLITSKSVFNLQRKKDKEITEPGNGWSASIKNRVAVVDIKYLGKQNARCITVDNEEHLFQAGEHHIVTHNTYMINNILDREFRLIPNSLTLVSSTNEETTNEAWNKIESGLNAIESLHRALKLKLITDSSETKYAGERVELPDGTPEDRGTLSRFEKIIYGKNPGKTRGKRPTKQLVEEFAAFPPSHQKGSLGACKRESRGSWYVMGSIKKCQVYYSGTGGTIENDEAEGIFCNPDAHEILATEDFGIKTGFFCPTHIKRAGTWEKTGCPDVTTATTEVMREREAAKSDPESYMGLLQEYPMTIKEVFIRKGSNIFDQDKIATQRINLDMNPDIPKPEKGFLKWVRAENGKITGVEWDPSPYGDIEIIEHPHWLSEAALPEERVPLPNLYVGGVDSIDQGTGDSAYAKDNKKGSELAALVKKRILDKGYFRTTSNLYVAKYKKRSADVRDDWDNALKLAYYYNSEMNIEYTKIGIVSHFRDRGFYHLLKKRPTINLQNADPNKQTHLIGTTAGGPIIDHQDQKIKAYIDDFYDTIYFKDLLEHLQDYNREDRTKFDLVIAMGLCELSDEDLMGAIAKPKETQSDKLQLFGYYTEYVNGQPVKKYGVIPDKSDGKKELDAAMSKSFNQHGGVRWIDMTDPKNPQYIYE